MVRLACPRCQNVVDADPQSPPPCPNCGFVGQGHEGGPQSGPPAAPPGVAQPAPQVLSQNYAGAPARPFGGFWIRVVAYLLDVIIIGMGVWMLQLILSPESVSRRIDPEAVPTALDNIFTLVSILGLWLYQALLESGRKQATVGKMAVGLKVTDLRGARISFGRATGRHFAQYLSAMILMIGFFMVGWTRYKQGLHDMIAGTLVYKKHHVPQPAPVPGTPTWS